MEQCLDLIQWQIFFQELLLRVRNKQALLLHYLVGVFATIGLSHFSILVIFLRLVHVSQPMHFTGLCRRLVLTLRYLGHALIHVSDFEAGELVMQRLRPFIGRLIEHDVLQLVVEEGRVDEEPEGSGREVLLELAGLLGRVPHVAELPQAPVEFKHAPVGLDDVGELVLGYRLLLVALVVADQLGAIVGLTLELDFASLLRLPSVLGQYRGYLPGDLLVRAVPLARAADRPSLRHSWRRRFFLRLLSHFLHLLDNVLLSIEPRPHGAGRTLSLVWSCWALNPVFSVFRFEILWFHIDYL